MDSHALRLASSLLLPLLIAAAPPPVTPMTPDVVASYNPVLPEADYIKRVVMVPMRDGVKLYTVIVMKKGTANGPSHWRMERLTERVVVPVRERIS